MKFITEDDLRILFRREPFASYDLPAQAKLTPGARQFLLDKKISFCDDPLTAKRKITKPGRSNRRGTSHRTCARPFFIKTGNLKGTVSGSRNFLIRQGRAVSRAGI